MAETTDAMAESTDARGGIVIVGGGAAGTACAQALSAAGGRAVLIDARPEPAELPPLSKSLFADDLDLRPHPRELPGIEALAGTVERIAEDAVHLADGTAVPYGTLVLATGLRPRPAPPALRGAHLVSDAEAARGLRAQAPGRELGILGSGFLALEAARGAADAGLTPTVHLRGALPLPGLHPHTARAVRDLHAAAGVRFAPYDPEPAPAAHPLWLAAVGAEPALPPLPQGWQSDVRGFAEVDAWLRIIGAGGRAYAIGDAAHVLRGPMAGYPPTAAESVALSQGAWLGARLADPRLGGGDEPGPDEPGAGEAVAAWTDVPWHWSFQGPVRVFTAGMPASSADPDAVIVGDLSVGRGQALLFESRGDDAELVGAETLGPPPAHTAARRVLAARLEGGAGEGRAQLTRGEAAREGFDLRQWARAHRG